MSEAERASVHTLELAEVVSETKQAIAEAGDIERRLFLFALRRWAGTVQVSDSPVLEMPAVAVASEIADVLGSADDYLKRLALYALRRWVVLGQGAYGPLSLGTGRPWTLDALEEQSDRALYRIMHSFDSPGASIVSDRAVSAVHDMADDFEAVFS